MGSSMSRIYDDYDTYKWICEKLNKKPVSIRGEESFYDEVDELEKENNCKDTYELISKISKDNG